MGKRKCPLCFVRVPRTAALAHSNEIVCPGCHARLELSRFTRIFAGLGGLAGALAAMHLARGLLGGIAWVMQVLAAILAFAIVSALCVLAAGDLVVQARAKSTGFPHSAR